MVIYLKCELILLRILICAQSYQSCHWLFFSFTKYFWSIGSAVEYPGKNYSWYIAWNDKKKKREKIKKRYQNQFQSINLVNSDRLLRSNDTMNNSISLKLRGSTTVKWIKFKHVQTLLYWWFGRQVFLSSFSLPLFSLSFFFLYIRSRSNREKKLHGITSRIGEKALVKCEIRLYADFMVISTMKEGICIGV